MKTKKMSRDEFENFVTTELIPDYLDEYERVDYVVLTKNNKFRLGKECNTCHDVILLGEEFDIPTEICKKLDDGVQNYFESLVELDVVDYDDIVECECWDTDEEDPYEEEEEDPYDDYLDEDRYDDYDE